MVEETVASASILNRRLRAVGIIVLAIGILAACVIYWTGTQSPKLKDDLSMVGYDKAQTRQMGHLYGKYGPMVDDLLDDLKRPGVQATIIVAISSLIALGCFQFQRAPEPRDGDASSS